MRHSTIVEIKERLFEFYSLVHDVAAYWKYADHYTTIEVLIQNASFNSDLSDDEALSEMSTIRDILKNFSKYYNSHFENWVYNEVDMIITGNLTSDEQEEAQEMFEAMQNDFKGVEDEL